jgi:DNA mismatch endonuclease (patch repair protein)
MDHVSTEVRSKIMGSVKSSDTGPELIIRRALHRLGYRYALHCKDLPGKPDIVFRSRRKAVFVNGCFWHGHNCRRGRGPQSKQAFWQAKIRNNRLRDAKVRRKLKHDGWSLFTAWQCQTRSLEPLVEKIVRFLESR